ncbi:MAG: myo-inositol-phosphate synthase, partial [Sphingomonadales bacterium]|nr:myo-inositol-phosphate synthase [Sphingomonadales bacterium]
MSLHDPQGINIAIVGVGNCASSLVQGLSHYSNGGANAQIGL